MANKWKLLPVMMVLWLLLLFGFTSHAAETTTGEYYGMTLAEWDEYVKEVTTNLNNQTWHMYDMMPYYFIHQHSDTRVVIYYSDNPYLLARASEAGFYYMVYKGIFGIVSFDYDGTGLTCKGVSGNYSTSGVSSYTFPSASSDVALNVFLSNYDLCLYGNNTVFFQQTPKAHLVDSVLVPVLIALPLREMTLKEVVGLLPLLMLFVVSVISFWKGWRFLSRVLRTL